MKRYLAFAWKNDRPHGGGDDFIGDGESPEEALASLPNDGSAHRGNILDTADGTVCEIEASSKTTYVWRVK